MFLISAQKHRLWYSLEPPCEAVLSSTHNLCFSRNVKNISEFLSESFQFLEVKFSIYLNRRVFVMILHTNKASHGHLLSI